MDENLKLIYKILNTLRDAMKFEEFDGNTIGYEWLGVPKPQWEKVMKMIAVNGYASGIKVLESDNSTHIVLTRPEITLKGLEYLEENALMNRAKELIKGVAGIIK